MKDYLSITELAKLRNLTTETLRHYDRIGLFKPEYVDPLNGRRYYTSNQFEILGTIRELRQLGMSLDDIKNYFDCRNLEKSVGILEEQHELLKKEIEEKELLEKILCRKLRFIEKIREIKVDYSPCLKHFPERYMISFGKMYTDGKPLVYSQTQLERHLIQKAPVLASDRMGFYTSVNIFEQSYSTDFPAAPMILCTPNEISESETHLRTISEGDYACVYYNGNMRIPEKQFTQIKKFIDDNNFTICGNIYIQYIIDVTLTSCLDEKLIEMQVPVKRKP